MADRTAWMVGIALAVLAAPLAPGCEGGVSGPGGTSPDERPPTPDGPLPDPDRPAPSTCETFEPVSPQVYGNKVKSLLTGQAMTDVELGALEADPGALTSLVEGWLGQPEADAKLQQFFQTAFQQEAFEDEGLASQYGEDQQRFGTVAGTNVNVMLPLRRNVQESFPRTVLQLIDEGRPFTDTVTTDTFMMTTAMMVVLSFADDRSRTDADRDAYRTLAETIPTVTFTTNEVIPLADTIDPASPNFMRFYTDDTETVPPCSGGEVAVSGNGAPQAAFRSVLGFLQQGLRAVADDTCRGTRTDRREAILTPADFDDWRLVRVRKPAAGEAALRFFDIAALRSAEELVVHTPRVGFFTTPAFFAVWATNEDNQARVTANQTLITAFNRSIDGTETVFPIIEDALDGEHANPSTACYSCHVTLDPLRQFFRRDYTYYYSAQRDEEVRSVGAAFAYDGVEATGNDIFELANILANHPLFAEGWTHKLCFYANAAECPENDPEFERVVQVFRDSGYDFRALVRELFTSPLITGSECIERGTGDNAGIARLRHFCSSLSNRLEVVDVCGQSVVWQEDRSSFTNKNGPVSSTIPDDTFSRGDEDPLTVSDVNLFVRGTYERICQNIAVDLVGSGKRFTTDDSEGAIAFFAEQLMGLPPSDTRHAGARAVLEEHFEAAQAEEGISATVALQSTFSLACMSPSLTGMGL